MWFENLLKFRIRERNLPRYTTKEDLPRATKELQEKALKEFFAIEATHQLEKELNRPKDWIDRDDKIVKDMERAAARHDKREIGGWLKAWTRQDRKEQRRFEREMARD